MRKSSLAWIGIQQTYLHHLPDEGEYEGDGDEELDDHEPPRKQLLADEAVLVAVEGVAAGEELVELVVGMAELVEAKLPQPHVLERRLRVLPRDEPVGRGEGHEQQEAGHEGGDGPVEQGVCKGGLRESFIPVVQ